jgi:D-alanyl-D-alanine carboxypeptidase
MHSHRQQQRSRMRQRAHLVAVAAALAAALGAGLAPAPAFATATAGPRVLARSAILVDAASGAVLWSRDPATPRAPASLTKMLTALLVRATLPLDAVAVAGKDAASAAPTKLGLRAGQKLRVGPALEALLILSANDVAVLLADRAGGSPERFQAAMNAEARYLGLRASAWHTPNGLDDRGHQASAYDLAILGRAVLRDPWLARVVRLRQATIPGPDGRRRSLHTHSGFLLTYPGAVGIKTGFTNRAGHCLAAAATRRGRTLIAVVLDSPSPPADAEALMDWGFSSAGGTAPSAATVSLATAPAGAAGGTLPPYVRPVAVDSLLPPASIPPAWLVQLPTVPPAAARWPALAAEVAVACAAPLLGAAVAVAARRRHRRRQPYDARGARGGGAIPIPPLPAFERAFEPAEADPSALETPSTRG